MDTIYKYNLDFGRAGDLEGLFVADSKDFDRMVEHGGRIYLGEVLGKHSEIWLDPERSDFKVLSSESKDIEVFKRLNLHVGFNFVTLWIERYGD